MFGQSSLFLPEEKYRSIEKEHLPEIDSGTSFFLVQTLKKFYMLGGWLANSVGFPAKPGRDLGKHCF